MPQTSSTSHHLPFSSEKLSCLIALVIVSSIDVFTTKNFLSFSIAWLVLLSAIFYDYLPLKYKRKNNLFHLIIWLKNYYFFTISFIFMFTMVRPDDKSLLDGLQLSILTVLLMKNLKPILSKFFLLLSVSALMIYFFQLELQSIIEIVFLTAIYLLHLFSKMTKKKDGLQTNNKFWKQNKVSNETQEYLDFVFLSCCGRNFILDRNLKFLYYGESLVIDLERKKQSLNKFLGEMARCEYRVRKESHEKSFSEVEIMYEISKLDQNNEFSIGFNELIRCVFNDKFDKVCLVVECNREGEDHQLIYIMRQNGKAFFRFISQDFARLMNEKNEVIQSYSKTISFVSHEFRTPLNCIINMLQAMQHTVENEITNNFIIPSLISSKFLLNLVNDLLDIAQLEAGKFKLIFLEFNFPALLEDTLQIISFQALNRKIELELKIDHEITMTKSDPNRVRQIITNLLSNFIYFLYEIYLYY